MNERLSKEDYAFGLTLGTKNNDRETPGDMDAIYKEQTYYTNVVNNRIRHVVYLPAKSAIKKYGEENLFAVIFKDISQKKSTRDGFKRQIETETAIKMPLTDFYKLYGKETKLNSAGVKFNFNL